MILRSIIWRTRRQISSYASVYDHIGSAGLTYINKLDTKSEHFLPVPTLFVHPKNAELFQILRESIIKDIEKGHIPLTSLNKSRDVPLWLPSELPSVKLFQNFVKERIRFVNSKTQFFFILLCACYLKQYDIINKIFLNYMDKDRSSPVTKFIYWHILDVLADAGKVEECFQLYNFVRGVTIDQMDNDFIEQFSNFLIPAISKSYKHRCNVALTLGALNYSENRSEYISVQSIAFALQIARNAKQPLTAEYIFENYLQKEDYIEEVFRNGYKSINMLFDELHACAYALKDVEKSIKYLKLQEEICPYSHGNNFAFSTAKQAVFILKNCEENENFKDAIDVAFPILSKRLRSNEKLVTLTSWKLWDCFNHLKPAFENGDLKCIVEKLEVIRLWNHSYKKAREDKIKKNKYKLNLDLQFEILLPCLRVCEIHGNSENAQHVSSILQKVFNLSYNEGENIHAALLIALQRAASVNGQWMDCLEFSKIAKDSINNFPADFQAEIDEIALMACVRAGEMKLAMDILPRFKEYGELNYNLLEAVCKKEIPPFVI